MVGNRPRALRVLRVCSVFEAPPASLTPRAVSFDPIGGMQNHTGQLTRALVELGVRQVIVTSRPPGAARCSRSRSVRVLRHGVHLPWARQLWAPLAATAALREARGADLVHAHVGEDVAVLPLALAAARVAAVPLVVTVHMSVRHTYLAAGLRGWQLKLLGGAAETTVVRRADAVIALTPRLAARMVADGIPAERLHVIPSGVTASDFAAAVGDPFPGVPRPRVLFVGRLHRQKGVGTLIEAAARLRTPGAQLIVVGDGPERAAGEAAARRLGLTRRVHFTGFAP